MRFHTVVVPVLAVFAAAVAAASGPDSGIMNALEARPDDCGTNGVAGGQCAEAFEQSDCNGPRVNFIKPDVSDQPSPCPSSLVVPWPHLAKRDDYSFFFSIVLANLQ